MPAVSDQLRFHAYMPTCTTVKPFKMWNGSNLKAYEVSFRILTLGQTLEISREIADESIHALPFVNRLHTLAYSIEKINNVEFVTDDEFIEYKKDNNLEDHQVTKHDYIIIQLKMCSEPVINALFQGYQDVLEQYLTRLRGKEIQDVVPKNKLQEEEPSIEPVDLKDEETN